MRLLSWNVAGRVNTAFPEKLLSASVEAPRGGLIEIHVFHAPTGVGSASGKVDALETLHGRLAEDPAEARIVCGDFNSPQVEPPGRRDRSGCTTATTGASETHPDIA